MAPMTASPLLVYEIPDACGQGHLLLIADGCGLSAEQAAALIGSIRGPVHLGTDRLGVVRASRQVSRGGAIRDASVVALIAGINVTSASPRTVLSALAALEQSLDAVVAEAANAVSVNDAPLIPSHAAAKVRDHIVQMGFEDCRLVHIAPAESLAADPEPHPAGVMAALPLLAGTLTVLVAGIAIGRIARGPPPWSHSGHTKADNNQTDSLSGSSNADDDGPSPHTISGDTEVDRPVAETPPEAAENAEVRRTTPVLRSGPVRELPPDVARSQPDSPGTGASITFHVQCEGTTPGERIQLLRNDNSRAIGRGHTATSTDVTFDETAPDGLSSPEQLKVSLWENPRRGWLGLTAPPPHVSQRFERRRESDQYSCSIEFGTATRRSITVTMTVIHKARTSAD